MATKVSNLDSQRVPATGATHLNKTVTASATALPEPGDATACVMFSVDGGNVRVRFDGEDPTASVGILLSNGGVGTWNKDTWTRALVIAESGSPVINGQGME